MILRLLLLLLLILLLLLPEEEFIDVVLVNVFLPDGNGGGVDSGGEDESVGDGDDDGKELQIKHMDTTLITKTDSWILTNTLESKVT